MKITPELLSIPPFISATWKSISSIYVTQNQGRPILVIHLTTGVRATIPNLDRAQIEAIFQAHATYSSKPILPTLDGFPQSLEHNPALADSPLLPPEFMAKLADMLKSLNLDSLDTLLKPVDACNCPYCQVARSLLPTEEPLVADEELVFRDWIIQQTSDKLYDVTNPLDASEHYSVFLGTPLGCTCGQKHCEHIKAVLNT